ncbi:MAG: hypothetical protein AABY02_02555 [Nanoarchaeota archaeon]
MVEVRHKCGFCVTHSLHDGHNILRDLQHRGRETFGFAAIGYGIIDVVKGLGRVDSFSLSTLNKIFDRQYHTFFGHVRYATRGQKGVEDLLKDAHPIALGGKIYLRGDHLIMRDCELVGVHNGQIDDANFEGMELGRLVTETDTEKFLRAYKQIGEEELMKRVPGAFTFAVAERERDEVVVMRDRTGIKPGVLGWKDGKFVVASENRALIKNGAEFREELLPGAVYYLRSDGSYRRVNVAEPSPRHCFFEWNYIAAAESTLNWLQVRRLREALGGKLAQEFTREVKPEKIDFVSYIPSCPEVAARKFAQAIGKKCINIFYKRDDERSFQGSDNHNRSSSIKRNLNLMPGIEEYVRGKTVVVIDDSTVRGTNAQYARKLLYDGAGVAEAYLLNYTPQIGIVPPDGIPRGCRFGVDMPPEEHDNHKFIARGRTIEQISEAVGMSVRFISVEGMLGVFEELGMPREKLCTYCIGGEHPFENSPLTQISVGRTM